MSNKPTCWEIKKLMYGKVVTTLEVYGRGMTKEQLERKYSGQRGRKLISVKQISKGAYAKRRKYTVRKSKKEDLKAVRYV